MTSDNDKSDLTSTSYSNNGARYINRWDRLDYTKQQTQQSKYNFNAWMYYSEYNFHMYAWNVLNLPYIREIDALSGIAEKARVAHVIPNDPLYDYYHTDGYEKWLRMIAYFSVGILGI